MDKPFEIKAGETMRRRVTADNEGRIVRATDWEAEPMTTPTPDPLDAIVADALMRLEEDGPSVTFQWNSFDYAIAARVIRAAVLADRERRAAGVEAAARALIGRRKPVASDVGGMVLVGRDAYFALVAALDAAPARPEEA